MNCPSISYLIVMLLTILTIHLGDKLYTTGCPSEVCTCKWKGGKQSVECGGQALQKIPEGMDPGTQVLNFSGNSLQVLQSERFLRMDLINLQKIFLSRNQLIKIHEKAFRGLSNLVELDLSENMLPSVPSETFQDYTSLMRLSLSGNPIRALKTSAFRHLGFLTTLELSNCQIDTIENEAFVGLDNLEWLRLDGNRISTIRGTHILPKSLHGINLQSNRWICDCHLMDFHSWLINYNIPQTDEPKCIEPVRLKGQLIKSLKKDELACLPDIVPKSTYTEISEGRNISLMCTVRAIPEATVLWLFNGQVLTNDSLLENLHMYYYIDESGGEEKRSEVFLYNVGPEDNGTFSCIARNTAGTSFTNYTIRVLIKEPPVVKEVSFAKNYMHVIVASGGGAGFIFVLLLCTIVVKCRQRKPHHQRKSSKSEQTSTRDNGLLKCPSIINDDDMIASPKSNKENGIVIGGVGAAGQMKQNLLMYVTTMPGGGHVGGPGHVIDASNMQLSHLMTTASSNATSPPLMNNGGSIMGTVGSGNISAVQYCSPQSSLRNYHQHQEKNPDLINDAESVKNKMRGDSEYEGSDCSSSITTSVGPCSLQGGNFENCYQLSNQFGSQVMRPTSQQQHLARFAPISTLPRGGLHMIKGAGGQHQVDVHLNPVCFLGQDGYAYDFSNNHIHTASSVVQPAPAVTTNQPNFYRTLPHNRGHKPSLQASAANPGTRYSLEAEFLQRTATPPYDKYAIHNMRFTAEGYPIHSMQFPSPPEGYKGDYSLPESLNSGQSSMCQTPSFQQWPPCLPGYHVQPIRYPNLASPNVPMNGLPSSVQQLQSHAAPNSSQTASTSASTLANSEVKKRCVGAQTTDESDTIPECDEENLTGTTGENSKLRHLTGPLADSPDEGYVGDSQDSSEM